MLDLKHSVDEEYGLRQDVEKRWKLTLQWLKNFSFEGSSALDLGDRTKLTESLESLLGFSIENTHFDLDYKFSLDRKFDYVFCFEVIEHPMNPLVCLESACQLLANNGRLFISTPIDRPRFLRGPRHFHEFAEDELMALIDKANFVVEAKTRINPVPWYWCFKGIRPLLRYIHFNRTILLCLKKKV